MRTSSWTKQMDSELALMPPRDWTRCMRLSLAWTGRPSYWEAVRLDCILMGEWSPSTLIGPKVEAGIK